MCVCIYVLHLLHIIFIHSSIEGQLDCFPNLGVVNKATINMGVQISLWDLVFISIRCIPKSGIASTCNSSSLNFLRNLHTVLYSGDTNLQSH